MLEASIDMSQYIKAEEMQTPEKRGMKERILNSGLVKRMDFLHQTIGDKIDRVLPKSHGGRKLVQGLAPVVAGLDALFKRGMSHRERAFCATACTLELYALWFLVQSGFDVWHTFHIHELAAGAVKGDVGVAIIAAAIAGIKEKGFKGFSAHVWESFHDWAVKEKELFSELQPMLAPQLQGLVEGYQIQDTRLNEQ